MSATQKTILQITAACVGLSALSYFLVVLYMDYKEFELSTHGHIAAMLAIFFTYSVGAALMALLFFSNKHGHDDQVHYILKEDNSDDIDGEK